MTPERRFIFVYAVDGGLFNALADTAHKLLSPSTYRCNLCALTHGLTSAHRGWTEFVRGLPLPSEFLHRDEFNAEHPGQLEPLPALYVNASSGLRLLISADEIQRCADLESLIGLVGSRAALDLQ